MGQITVSIGFTHWIRDWGTLIVTAILVAVTAWYVALTKSMANAASISAENSRQAADAARLAASAADKTATAAIAGLAIDYEVTYWWTVVADRMTGVMLTATGATAFVHAVVLNKVAQKYGEGGEKVLSVRDVEMRPSDLSLPVILHSGEGIQFSLPPESNVWRHSNISSASLTVYYSLTLDSPVIARRIKHPRGNITL
ncbi:hypothetical protein P9869_35820 [Streptomyces ossamyceticus]|nr:hypothetical protein [Streptomyces ossamyceticus]